MILQDVAGSYVGAVTDGGRQKMLKQGFACLLILSNAVVVAGCGGGGGSPFGGASSNELLFVSAAQTWDLDKNSSVTCEEWANYTTQLFTEADGNQDGALTAEEYKRVIRSDRLFQSASHKYFDANGDGKVVVAEMTGKPNPAFTILDRNKDCQIGPNEMVHTRQIQKLKKAANDGPPAGDPAGGIGR